MAMRIEFTGDWERVRNLAERLKPAIKTGAKKALMKSGLYGERMAVKAIQNQRMPDGGSWVPLKAAYLRLKLANNRSEKIYVSSSTLLQAITSSTVLNRNGVLTVKFGVKRGVNDPETGEEVANIAAIMEFGNSRMPARPLWRPSKRAMLTWMVTERVFTKAILQELERLVV